jgi:hypothetical protein
MFTRPIRTFVAAALLASVAAPALAQTDEYRQQLESQLSAAREIAESENLGVVAGPFFGSLAEDATDTFTLSVEKGRTYQIVGVCDNDCSDLDIRLKNNRGEVIGEDELDDDAPVVELVPTISGRVTIEVEMFACSSAPCYFAVEVYGGS